MCLILAAYQAHTDYPLIILANRDEFHKRPSQAAHWWDDPKILAGKDLKAGGTWLGVHTDKRFCALTNYREPEAFQPEARSRGSLVIDFLKAPNLEHYKSNSLAERSQYNDFNLLLYERNQLYFYGSKTNDLKTVQPGISGLSNHLLDSPWPKVKRGKSAMGTLVASEEIDVERAFAILADDVVAPDGKLPETGVGIEMERLLSPLHIQAPGYGTVSSNVILFHRSGRVDFYERGHLDGGEVVFSW